jgi:hypothetical protein
LHSKNRGPHSTPPPAHGANHLLRALDTPPHLLPPRDPPLVSTHDHTKRRLTNPGAKPMRIFSDPGARFERDWSLTHTYLLTDRASLWDLASPYPGLVKSRWSHPLSVALRLLNPPPPQPQQLEGVLKAQHGHPPHPKSPKPSVVFTGCSLGSGAFLQRGPAVPGGKGGGGIIPWA